MIICGHVGHIHIPRTGGTSVRHALASQSRPLFSLTAMGKPHADVRADGNQYNAHTPLAKFADCDFIRILTLFSVVRNPWDRYVSWYEYHRMQTGSNRTFDEFMQTLFSDGPTRRKPGVERNPITQSEYVAGIDHERYDYSLLQYELLGSQWEEFCDYAGLRFQPLDRLNGSDREAYQSYYHADGQRWIDVVRDREAYVIQRFGYQFGA